MNINIYIRYVDNIKWNCKIPPSLSAAHYTVKAVATVDDDDKVVSYFDRNSTPASAIYESLKHLSKIYGFQCSYNMRFDKYKDNDGLKITITHKQRQYYGALEP